MSESKTRIDPQLYDEFLLELRALDEFRAQMSARNPEQAVRRDDPDVRRMLEAVAYFTVRSRQQLLHNMQATWLRLFSDQFEPLLTTLPATAMAQAQVEPRRAEATLLPRGTELRIPFPDGQSASFRTLEDLRLLPCWLDSAVLLRDAGGAFYRVALQFSSRFGRTDPVGLLRLHTRIADDYAASARFLYGLRAHLQRAHVVYDSPLSDHQVGDACHVSYGSAHPPSRGTGSGGPEGGPETTHPLLRVRSLFQFPERELFLNLEIPPVRGNKPWQRFLVYLDLSPDWPAEHIGPDLFQLHAVPVVNLVREAAVPLLCDGTQDALPVRHPSPDKGFALHSLRGVYAVTESGLSPLRSSTLPESTNLQGLPVGEGGAFPSYQLEERLTPLGPRPNLVIRAPLALLSPLRLSVDATWYQPGLAALFARYGMAPRPQLTGRVLEGVQWSLLGGVRAETDSPLRNEMSALLRILSMGMRPTLSDADLRWLLTLLIGTGGPAGFRSMPSRLEQLTWSLSPDSALRGSGTQHVYRARLRIESGEDEALVWLFLCSVFAVLDAWNHDSSVDLKVETGSHALRLPLSTFFA
ncbi:MAG: type VI secretion system baseplate subunit TssF [Myxococcales bacterium]|nr:type VI secretion system baseplate subunit TssF [Myxococcales bacterium]